MTTVVRDYQVTDKAACLSLFDGNVPEFFDASERDMFSGFLDAPEGDYFVIEMEGRVCGCGGIVREDRGQARFTWGMVDNSLHGAGLGRLLAEYRLQVIEAAGDYSEAELFTTHRVAPFFAKFGFETRGVEKDGFAPGMDKVQMIRPVTS
ncbi:MAG: GNAT family N-acetyltransferase [Pseudomonadota bacterium]